MPRHTCRLQHILLTRYEERYASILDFWYQWMFLFLMYILNFLLMGPLVGHSMKGLNSSSQAPYANCAAGRAKAKGSLAYVQVAYQQVAASKRT